MWALNSFSSFLVVPSTFDDNKSHKVPARSSVVNGQRQVNRDRAKEEGDEKTRQHKVNVGYNPQISDFPSKNQVRNVPLRTLALFLKSDCGIEERRTQL